MKSKITKNAKTSQLEDNVTGGEIEMIESTVGPNNTIKSKKKKVVVITAIVVGLLFIFGCAYLSKEYIPLIKCEAIFKSEVLPDGTIKDEIDQDIVDKIRETPTVFDRQEILDWYFASGESRYETADIYAEKTIGQAVYISMGQNVTSGNYSDYCKDDLYEQHKENVLALFEIEKDIKDIQELKEELLNTLAQNLLFPYYQSLLPKIPTIQVYKDAGETKYVQEVFQNDFAESESFYYYIAVANNITADSKEAKWAGIYEFVGESDGQYENGDVVFGGKEYEDNDQFKKIASYYYKKELILMNRFIQNDWVTVKARQYVGDSLKIK